MSAILLAFVGQTVGSAFSPGEKLILKTSSKEVIFLNIIYSLLYAENNQTERPVTYL